MRSVRVSAWRGRSRMSQAPFECGVEGRHTALGFVKHSPAGRHLSSRHPCALGLKPPESTTLELLAGVPLWSSRDPSLSSLGGRIGSVELAGALLRDLVLRYTEVP